jgi:Asp-tRNA(Asn)/Glu-tRNA(Gln) amidotransferase A subunit family amidase
VVGKANGPRGERIDLKGPINDLDRIAWKERKVFIVFDTNVHTVDSVRLARKGLARELATRGAEVEFVNLPQDCGVNGIDDLLGI